MSLGRRRTLLIVRSLLVLLAILALASPAKLQPSKDQAVVIIVDHSASMGTDAAERLQSEAEKLSRRLPSGTPIAYLSAGKSPAVLATPDQALPALPAVQKIASGQLGDTNLASSIEFSSALFPPGTAKHVMLLTDGNQTQGDLLLAARQAAATGVQVHALPLPGEAQPDARISRLEPSQVRITEGASLQIEAQIESSISGPSRLRLFENGIQIEDEEIELAAGKTLQFSFQRTPDKRQAYTYRAVLSPPESDQIPQNNEALALVDVRGKPLVLYVEGEPQEAHYLIDAMNLEGIRLELRQPSGIPTSLGELASYDAIILSDVPAGDLPKGVMQAMRTYVDELGGGLLMLGGKNSFALGGYKDTPLEEVLPVRLQSPDEEEQQSAALALVIDRSGSMAGEKIDVCKSAAVATANLLSKKDSIGVYAFDSRVHVVVPMTRLNSTSAIASQIATLNSGGGTFIRPGMERARADLAKVRAKIKHMIVLTDGQTTGEGYESLASQCRGEGITISTVAVGAGAQVGLLQSIASAGGGQAYVTMDPGQITRIFTQDTLVHTGKMIREDAFQPEIHEPHAMIEGIVPQSAPPLLGYVRTVSRKTSQVPLLTDTGDPLLAHWRYGLGKSTAFASDCKSRWSKLWVTRWPGYSQLWAQILRNTARPPQGQLMDLVLQTSLSGTIGIEVDLLEDAGTRKEDARVEADLFFLPPSALGSAMQPLDTIPLNQAGPGFYRSQFVASEPGVYLVRARSGAQTVSAGYVHAPSSEVATGQVNLDLLSEAAQLTGGTILENNESPISLTGSATASLQPYWPTFLKIFLVLVVLDLAIRRWENVQGMWDVFNRRKEGKA